MKLDEARAAILEEHRRVEKAFGTGLLATGRKLKIGTSDVYVHAATEGGRLVSIAIESDKDTRKPELELERGNVQVAASQASTLLQSGLWTVEDVVASWRGVRVGAGIYWCEQLKRNVGGVLDAVGRLLAKEMGDE
ncbi:MAG: hypothetical protein GY851_07295 [bacterium]|nr:hypothetical protein [bacterium]